MADLVQWLTAQLDADERIARSAVREHEQQIRLVDCDAGDRWFRRYSDYGGTEVVDVHGHAVVSTAHDKGSAVRTHIAAHDPARVLREVEVDRELLAEYERLLRAHAAHKAEAARMAEAGDDDPTRIAALRREADYLPAMLHVMERWAKRKAAVYEDRPGFAEAIASVD